MIEGVELKERPGDCVACGNSPTNHTVTYILNTLSLALAPLSYRFLRSRIAPYVWRVGAYVHYYCAWMHYGYSYVLGIVRYNSSDMTLCNTYRSQVIWEEAQRRGIRMEQVKIYGKPIDTYRAFLSKHAIYFESLPIPPWLISPNQQWIDDKWYLKQILRHAGIAVPECESVTTARGALDAFNRIGSPVIIKPRLGTRGRHTETYITSQHDVRHAFTSARVLCHFVCVEKHLAGSVCRGTLVNKKLVGFFEAKPIVVVGDGVSTVRQLVDKKNATRHERVHPITLTQEHEIYVRKHGYGLDDVLDQNTVVPLTHRTGRLFGGETREMLDTVHPRMRVYLEKASRVIDVPIVGFDLIIPHPEEDPDKQTWGVIEANAVPFIDLHYLPLFGTPSITAKYVWDLWLK